MQYVAFLRGINVGGNVIIKMTDLKKEFEKLGYENVKTILASGNVVFEIKDKKREIKNIEEEIVDALHKKYGRGIAIFVRTMRELKRIEALQPFLGIKVTPNTRLYVTFCSERPKSLTASKPHPGYKILGASGTAVFSVLEVSPLVKTPDLMKVLGDSVGKEITMRNWNTVKRILANTRT